MSIKKILIISIILILYAQFYAMDLIDPIYQGNFRISSDFGP